MGKTLLILCLKLHAACRTTLLQSLLIRFQHLRLKFGSLVASGLGSLKSLCQTCVNRLQILQLKLIVDDLHIAHRIDITVNVSDIVIVETTEHVEDGISLTDIREELVAETLTLGGTLHKTGYIHDLDSGGHHTARVAHLHKFIKTLIGHRDHTDVGFYRTEREIR